MSDKPGQFMPFYDRRGTGGVFSYSIKVAISLGIGLLYSVLQYISMTDKTGFFEQQCWILGIIISTAMLTLYIATDLFRCNLPLVEKLEGRFGVSKEVLESWLTDKGYVFSGLAFMTLNTTIAHTLGVPAEFHSNPYSLAMIYIGFLLSGFTCGMGMYGIVGIIVMYLKLAPCLQQSLDLTASDGRGGLKPLGDTLWFFSLLIAAVGMLVTLYLFRVDWTNTHRESIRLLVFAWAAFPYLAAISVVLIPGLAVRRNVQSFKQHKAEQLNKEKAQIFSELKEFRDKSDQEIVNENRELADRLQEIQDKIARLKAMRDSHIDKD